MSENQDVIEKIEINQETPVEKVKDVEESPDIKTEENQANWKKFREEREKDRKARIEAEAQAKKKSEEAEAMKAAMEALLSQNNPQPYQNDAYDEYETDEQKVARLVKEQLERERKLEDEKRRKEEAARLPQKLASDYKDFGNVCNSENLDYLEYHHPEIALAFSQMPESYEKWSSIYKAVKKLVPFSEKNKDQSRMDKNLLKPQASSPSVADPSESQSGWRLTEQKRMDNWRRMQQDMRSM